MSHNVDVRTGVTFQPLSNVMGTINGQVYDYDGEIATPRTEINHKYSAQFSGRNEGPDHPIGIQRLDGLADPAWVMGGYNGDTTNPTGELNFRKNNGVFSDILIDILIENTGAKPIVMTITNATNLTSTVSNLTKTYCYKQFNGETMPTFADSDFEGIASIVTPANRMIIPRTNDVEKISKGVLRIKLVIQDKTIEFANTNIDFNININEAKEDKNDQNEIVWKTVTATLNNCSAKYSTYEENTNGIYTQNMENQLPINEAKNISSVDNLVIKFTPAENYGLPITASASINNKSVGIYNAETQTLTIPASEITDNISVTAEATQSKFTLTVESSDTNMGSVTGGGTYNKNASAPITATANPGYHFTNWNGNTNLTSATTTVTITKNIVYTANFAGNEYTITYYNNHNSSDTSSTTDSFIYSSSGTTINKTPTEKTGYTFNEWNTKQDGTGTQYSNGTFYKVAGHLTLYAKWTANEYTITFNANGGSACGSITVTYNAQIGNLPTTTRTGYTFGGWYENSDFTGESITEIVTGSTGDKDLYAKWTANTYTLSFDANGGSGKNCPSSITVTYDSEITNMPTQKPTRVPYNFTGWNSKPDGTGTQYSNGTVYKVAGDLTLYAKWTANNYHITYNLNGGANYIGAPETYTIESETITLGTPTKEGYTFGGWYENSGFTGNPITKIETGSTGNKSLYAKWTVITYNITYNLNGGANYTGAPTSYTIESADITLGEPTKTGYTFGGWYTDSNLTQSITQIVTGSTGDLTLNAKWTANNYHITYNLDGGTNYTGAPSTYTVETPTITLGTPTKEGYTFGGWYTDSNLTQSITQIVTGSTGDKSLYAKWNLVSYSITYNLDGGANYSGAPSTYTIESADITLGEPTKTGYTFNGWYTDSDLTQSITQIVTGSTGDLTLNAKWTANELTFGNQTLSSVVYGSDINQDVTGAGNGTGSYTYSISGNSTTYPTGLTLTNGHFSGTITGNVGSYSFTVTATDSKSGATKNATYTLEVTSATLNAPTGLSWNKGVASWTAPSGVSGITITYSVQLYKNSSVIPGFATSSISGTSYDFTSVIRNNGAGEYTFTVQAISNNTSNCANSEQATSPNSISAYSITTTTVSGVSSYTITVGGVAVSVAISGEIVTVKAIVSDGYTFGSWVIDGSYTLANGYTLTSNPINCVVNGNLTFTAGVELEGYQVSLQGSNFCTIKSVNNTNLPANSTTATVPNNVNAEIVVEGVDNHSLSSKIQVTIAGQNENAPFDVTSGAAAHGVSWNSITKTISISEGNLTGDVTISCPTYVIDTYTDTTAGVPDEIKTAFAGYKYITFDNAKGNCAGKRWIIIGANDKTNFGNAVENKTELNQGQVLLLSETILEERRYSGGSANWLGSEIRAYLNDATVDGFYGKSGLSGYNIKPQNLTTAWYDGSSVTTNETTADKIFLLATTKGFKNATLESDYLSQNFCAQTYLGEASLDNTPNEKYKAKVWWWLRSGCNDTSGDAWGIAKDGKVDDIYVTSYCRGIRPAFVLDLNDIPAS